MLLCYWKSTKKMNEWTAVGTKELLKWMKWEPRQIRSGFRGCICNAHINKLKSVRTNLDIKNLLNNGKIL